MVSRLGQGAAHVISPRQPPFPGRGRSQLLALGDKLTEASYMPRADVFSVGEACREAYEGLHVPVQGENWVLGQGGMLSEGRASHFPSLLHSYLLRNLSRLKLVMAYVECLLRAGHGTGLHAESQEEGTLIPAVWLDLCVPRWCPGPVVSWAKRSAKRWCPEPRGVP